MGEEAEVTTNCTAHSHMYYFGDDGQLHTIQQTPYETQQVNNTNDLEQAIDDEPFGCTITTASTTTQDDILTSLVSTFNPYWTIQTHPNSDYTICTSGFCEDKTPLEEEVKELRKRINNLTSIMLEFLGEERMKKIIQEKCDKDDSDTSE